MLLTPWCFVHAGTQSQHGLAPWCLVHLCQPAFFAGEVSAPGSHPVGQTWYEWFFSAIFVGTASKVVFKASFASSIFLASTLLMQGLKSCMCVTFPPKVSFEWHFLPCCNEISYSIVLLTGSFVLLTLPNLKIFMSWCTLTAMVISFSMPGKQLEKR